MCDHHHGNLYVPNYTAILLDYTAQSLYCALHRGINMTWPADLSNITTQPNINKRCLVKGLNTLGPHPWQIKSRVGLVSQSSSECSLPYLVRGLGISYKDRKPITCGDIIIKNQMTFETYPGFCRIYIQ